MILEGEQMQLEERTRKETEGKRDTDLFVVWLVVWCMWIQHVPSDSAEPLLQCKCTTKVTLSQKNLHPSLNKFLKYISAILC